MTSRASRGWIVAACAAGAACAARPTSSAPAAAAVPATAPPAPTALPAATDDHGLTRDHLLWAAPLPAAFRPYDGPGAAARVALGHQLFFEPRLSKHHDVACATCHPLDRFGVDGRPRSRGHLAQLGARNTPTVFNAAGHFRQFWDGRADTVETQALGPILDPVEMAMPDEARVVATLASIPEYVAAFTAAFPDDPTITLAHVGEALGAYERLLVTPAPYDRFLAGDDAALDATAKRGLRRFVQLGCISCHAGPLLGGQMFQPLGKRHAWPASADQGRLQHTGDEADRLVFKSTSLRNVARTAPYFHDGSEPSLAEAVRRMAWHQLGQTPSDADVAAIVAFLESLTGEPPAALIAPPRLPPPSKRTPRADASPTPARPAAPAPATR